MKLITLFLTCANEEEAKHISKKLLDKKLAACVRTTDVKSDFWWKGQQEQDAEVLLIIESSEEKFDEIEAAVKAVHSYETFVLTAYPVVKSSAGAEEWVKETIG
jgi:periplasmic divalent cation tolerance protein